jgi:hypothetical protein
MFCNKAIKTKDVLDYGLAIYILKCILRQKQFMEIQIFHHATLCYLKGRTLQFLVLTMWVAFHNPSIKF